MWLKSMTVNLSNFSIFLKLLEDLYFVLIILQFPIYGRRYVEKVLHVVVEIFYKRLLEREKRRNVEITAFLL